MDIILLVDSSDESVTELALAWNLSRSVILSSDISLLIFVEQTQRRIQRFRMRNSHLYSTRSVQVLIPSHLISYEQS